MSIDLTFEGDAVGAERVADAWDEIEQRFGPERVEALEDAGLSIEWGDDHLELSFPLGQDHTDFDRLADLVAREVDERFDWEVGGD